MNEDKGTAGAVVGLDVEAAVRERYTRASQQREAQLCCPVSYDPRYLKVLPPEIVERDYGCGDPTGEVQPGETVVDLGSGAGKVCYIASQMVGPEGRVIGVDMNDQMLALARKHQQAIGDRIGWHNVQFRKGRIQDLALDLELLDQWLREHPIQDVDGWLELQRRTEQLRREQPMIPDQTVDVILSNCVLNLVPIADRPKLFREMFRVLRPGGRAVISDIVCDEEVPEQLKQDPQLWSGCISGAFQEEELLRFFAEAGFVGMALRQWRQDPWAVVEGIEFRSVTVVAYKPQPGPCLEGNHAVIYRGPWKSVTDDQGHVFRRGVRTAVCEKTFRQLTEQPYAQDVIPIAPYVPVPPEQMQPFDCSRKAPRHPRETKQGRPLPNQLPAGDSCWGGNGDGRCC